MGVCMENFQLLKHEDLLGIMSKTFNFDRVDPPLPQLRHLGQMRVVSVIINEDSLPEIGLRSEGDADDHVCFYAIDQLTIVGDQQLVA